MNWLTKVLGALTRPLGISSPEDIRDRASSKVNDKRTFHVTASHTSNAEPPKDTTSIL